MAGGVHGRGACVAAEGHAWQGAWQVGYAWQGHVWLGSVYGRGQCVAGGPVWPGWGGGGACVAGQTVTTVGGTHRTGTHSCLLIISNKFFTNQLYWVFCYFLQRINKYVNNLTIYL